MRLEWFEEAQDEFADAASYYFWEEPGLEEEFIAYVERAVDTIRRDPQRHREFAAPLRKLGIDRFPYQLIYAIDGDLISILALMHQSRKPGYWRERLGG